MKKKIIIALVIALLALGVGVFAVQNNGQDNTNNSLNTETNQQNDTDSTPDAEAPQNTGDDAENNDTSSTPAPTKETDDEAAQTPPSEPVVEILQASQSGSKVIVQTSTGTISSGTCILTAKRGGSETTKSAEILFAPDYSICKGFEISTSELGAGNWTLQLRVESGDKNYKSEEVSLNVT